MSRPITNWFQRAQRIANRCKTVKGWKGGALGARNEKKTDVGELYIYADIGFSWFDEAVTAESVRKALDGLKGVKTLNVFINSPGGDVFEAKAIYTQLKRFGAEKVVYIDGIAASAASFIAMAGDRIVTSPAATWMVHQASTIAWGNADTMREQADLLDMLDGDIANIYAERTDRPAAELLELMKAETWMTAEQALEEGFTDEIASYDGGDDDEATDAKASAKTGPLALLDAQRSRQTAMQVELMQFRAKRLQNASLTVAPVAVSEVSNQSSPQGRASATKPRAASASRG